MMAIERRHSGKLMLQRWKMALTCEIAARLAEPRRRPFTAPGLSSRQQHADSKTFRKAENTTRKTRNIPALLRDIGR